MKELLNYKLFTLLDVPITPWKILLCALIIFIAHLLIRFVKAFIHKTLKKRGLFDDDRAGIIFLFARLAIYVLALLSLIYALDMDSVWSEFLDFELISPHGEGGLTITFRDLLTFVSIILLARVVIRVGKRILKKSLSNNKRLDAGQRYTITKVSSYIGYIIAVILAANTVGIDLNALLLGSAALLVGVGFALQHIFDDIISGFIMLFEGTFEVGDVIETEGMIARVLHMDIRTSKVITRDGNIIIVPNRMLTSEKLNNWSHGSELSRFHITVGVSYSTDPDQVKKLLYQCALAHKDVSKKKEIVVRFDDFGDSALVFSLYFWATRSWDIELLKSDLRFAVSKSFKEHNVEIPFPQRDIHLKGIPEGLKNSGARPL